MADHQPDMRTQHRQMVGDGLGVGRAHPDIDQGDAVAMRLGQVIGRHLRQLGQGGAVGRLALHRGAPARLDKTRGAACFHFPGAVIGELVDIALVVGEQHEALEQFRLGAV